MRDHPLSASISDSALVGGVLRRFLFEALCAFFERFFDDCTAIVAVAGNNGVWAVLLDGVGDFAEVVALMRFDGFGCKDVVGIVPALLVGRCEAGETKLVRTEVEVLCIVSGKLEADASIVLFVGSDEDAILLLLEFLPDLLGAIELFMELFAVNLVRCKMKLNS